MFSLLTHQQWLPIQYIYMMAFMISPSHSSFFFSASINHHEQFIVYYPLMSMLTYNILNYTYSVRKKTHKNHKHKQKPVYSTKSIPRLISTLPKLPPWINFPTVTRKCTAVAGNLVHFHCVMDLTWLITRRLGITLVL